MWIRGYLLVPFSSPSSKAILNIKNLWSHKLQPCISQARKRYCSLSPTNSQEQFSATAKKLFAVGAARHNAGKASENVYAHFLLPSDKARSMEALLKNCPSASTSPEYQDFHTISSTVAEFGLPELADQMSGAIYMHATTTEDMCSKCCRVGETVVNQLPLDHLELALESMSWWPSNCIRSLAVMDVVKGLDRACINYLENSPHFYLKMQLRLCFLWLNTNCGTRASFPGKALGNTIIDIQNSTMPVIISFLLLLSALDDVNFAKKPGFGEGVSARLLPAIVFLSEQELVAAYLGLARLEGGPNLDKLKDYLYNTYGYRL